MQSNKINHNKDTKTNRMNAQTVTRIDWRETLKRLEVGQEYVKKNPTLAEVNNAKNRASFLKKEGYLFEVITTDIPFLKITCSKKP